MSAESPLERAIHNLSFFKSLKKRESNDAKVDEALQDAWHKFGGPTGSAVTFEDMEDVLRLELEASRLSDVSDTSVYIGEFPPEIIDLSILEQAQNLHTPEGVQASRVVFHIAKLGYERRRSYTEDRDQEVRRKAIACGATIELLTLPEAA